MVNYKSDKPLDATFRALADPTRRAILARLVEGEATVGEIAAPLPMSLPAVSKHLRILEGAGLLVRRIEGRTHRCRIEPAALVAAGTWIERYRAMWDGKLDRLARYLDETAPTDAETTTRENDQS